MLFGGVPPPESVNSDVLSPTLYRGASNIDGNPSNLIAPTSLQRSAQSNLGPAQDAFPTIADTALQHRPIPAQWFQPFIDTLKPMFEGSGDVLGIRKFPVPPLPRGMTPRQFGNLMRWGSALDAKPWVEQVAKDPAFAKQLIDALQRQGITKDMMGKWARFYEDTFKSRGPDAPGQFGYRSQGLRRLYEQFPEGASTAPEQPPLSQIAPCPGPLCGAGDDLEV